MPKTPSGSPSIRPSQLHQASGGTNDTTSGTKSAILKPTSIASSNNSSNDAKLTRANWTATIRQNNEASKTEIFIPHNSPPANEWPNSTFKPAPSVQGDDVSLLNLDTSSNHSTWSVQDEIDPAPSASGTGGARNSSSAFVTEYDIGHLQSQLDEVDGDSKSKQEASEAIKSLKKSATSATASESPDQHALRKQFGRVTKLVGAAFNRAQKAVDRSGGSRSTASHSGAHEMDELLDLAETSWGNWEQELDDLAAGLNGVNGPKADAARRQIADLKESLERCAPMVDPDDVDTAALKKYIEDTSGTIQERLGEVRAIACDAAPARTKSGRRMGVASAQALIDHMHEKHREVSKSLEEMKVQLALLDDNEAAAVKLEVATLENLLERFSRNTMRRAGTLQPDELEQQIKADNGVLQQHLCLAMRRGLEALRAKQEELVNSLDSLGEIDDDSKQALEQALDDLANAVQQLKDLIPDGATDDLLDEIASRAGRLPTQTQATLGNSVNTLLEGSATAQPWKSDLRTLIDPLLKDDIATDDDVDSAYIDPAKDPVKAKEQLDRKRARQKFRMAELEERQALVSALIKSYLDQVHAIANMIISGSRAIKDLSSR